MDDPWKYLAFPLAGTAGYATSVAAMGLLSGSLTGMGEIADQSVIVAASSLVVGFIVDELIPAYIHEKRGESGDGVGGGIGDGGSDLDLDS